MRQGIKRRPRPRVAAITSAHQIAGARYVTSLHICFPSNARRRNMRDAALTIARERQISPSTVLHWYDFLCPFCYVGQARTAILVRHGLDVVELPFQAHPDIPLGGVPAPARN